MPSFLPYLTSLQSRVPLISFWAWVIFPFWMPPFLFTPWSTQTCLLQEAFPECPAKSNLLLHLDSEFCLSGPYTGVYHIPPRSCGYHFTCIWYYFPESTSSRMEVAIPHISLCASQSPALALHMGGAHGIPTDFKGDLWSSLSCSLVQFPLGLIFFSCTAGRLDACFTMWTSGHKGETYTQAPSHFSGLMPASNLQIMVDKVALKKDTLETKPAGRILRLS